MPKEHISPVGRISISPAGHISPTHRQPQRRRSAALQGTKPIPISVDLSRREEARPAEFGRILTGSTEFRWDFEERADLGLAKFAEL
jgi:hypothetical protein